MTIRACLYALAMGGVLWLMVAALILGTVHAQETAYTPADVIAAIDEASTEIGVSAAYLERVIRCEDPSLDPYAVGRQGELGAAQLHPRGLLPKFYALGYLDPFSPYQAVRFLAQEISFGRARAWSCAR